MPATPSPAEIYDNPSPYMTRAQVFQYAEVDIIPLRNASGDRA